MTLAATLLLNERVVHAATAQVGEAVMGTVLEVTVIAADPDTARQLATSSIDIARHWDDVLTTWRAQGELEQLNTHAGSGPVGISTDLASALARILALARATGGAFDPAVGPAVEALRSGAAAQPHPSGSIHDVLTLGGATATLATGARLDSGGIGKGIALDAIAAHLAARGASAWFLDFGGSSQLAGGRPEAAAEPWTVLIAGECPGSVHGTVRFARGSLSTSRALRPHDAAGAIVDPRTGIAVAAPRLATVLAPDATTADAWSTAVVVLGRDGIRAAEAAGVEALFEDAAGTAMTPGFPLVGDGAKQISAASDGGAASRSRQQRKRASNTR